MTTLLHIDASARTSRSLSRDLSRTFVTEWQQKRPGDRIISRDLGANPPPAISEAWIAAVFTKPEELSDEQRALIALSDELITELAAADVIVLGTPMYNYGMPTALKGWVDQVIRINKTFTFDLARGDFPLEPILHGKTLVLLTASGEFGYAPGGIRATWDHLTPHIRTIQHYLGVATIHHAGIEYQEFGGDLLRDSIAAAHEAARALCRQLAVADAA